MSKAFTKDDAPDAPVVVPRRAPLPVGVPNYVTPDGLAALRLELTDLLHRRAELALGELDTTRAQHVAGLDARIVELEIRLGSAELVPPDRLHQDEVRFGARVTVRSAAGDAPRVYRIVGVDEADASEGRVAFVAPLARALLGKRVGDVATVRAPHGEDEIEVIAITYEQ